MLPTELFVLFDENGHSFVLSSADAAMRAREKDPSLVCARYFNADHALRIDYHSISDDHNRCSFTLHYADGRSQVFRDDPRRHGFPLPENTDWSEINGVAR